MKAKFAALIDVKSILTLTLTAVFAVLALKGTITPEQFMTIFSVVISFFFGTKAGKADAESKAEKEGNA